MSTTDRSSLATSFSRSATFFRPAAPYADYSFIAVLALAQRLHINFLPLIWQAALGPLGRGGQAGINQALINLQTSFAFKCFKGNSPIQNSKHTPFQDIVSEMIVLSHPSIRKHPYIVRLEGICWDIPEDEQVWPVLVFQKTHLGDLYDFARSGNGRYLSMEERLKLCVDIGIAVRDMHSNNIIHGDIKPKNVLIFEDNAGGYVARVADFGFSTQFRGDHDLISMPRSPPWNAREHHFREFKPQAAKRMDVYSFGMLCLWLLFGSKSFATMPLPPQAPQEKGQFINFEDTSHELNLLECWKTDSSNRFSEWATWLVVEHGCFENEMQSKLARFFDLTLAYEPDKRCTDFEILLHLLCPTRVLPQTEIFEVGPVQQHEHFEIASSLIQFYSADFQLRSFIATSLESIASESTPFFQHISTQEAAFQVALCYRIGFGVPKNDGEAKKFVGISPLNDKDLEHQVFSIKDDKLQWSMQDGIFKNLLLQGHIKSIYFPQYYRAKGLLLRAECNYKREIIDTQETFGETHQLNLTLRGQLGAVLEDQGRWKEAEELFVQVMEAKKKVLGQEHPSTLTGIANLASTYRNQGRWKEAEELEVQVMEAKKRVLGQEHPSTLNSIANIASTYENQGRWKEAEEVEVQVMEVQKRVLGQEHPDTLASMGNLASTYQNQGRWKEAEELQRQVVETSSRVLGQEHPSMLNSMANLASTFWNRGRWKEAEELQRQVVETSSRVLGQEHPETLTIIANLASTFWNQGRWKEAEELQRQAVEMSSRVLGQEHPETLTRMANLALTFLDQGQWKEAEELEVKVMEARKKVLGEEHPETLTIMANLASTFWNQGQWKEAEELQRQVVETSSRVLGQEHPKTLTSMANLASTFLNQGKWKEAEELFIQVIEARKRMLGQEHPSTLTTMANLASTYQNQGRWKEAEEL